MSFGRSNSLSLNTGAANSLFIDAAGAHQRSNLDSNYASPFASDANDDDNATTTPTSSPGSKAWGKMPVRNEDEAPKTVQEAIANARKPADFSNVAREFKKAQKKTAESLGKSKLTGDISGSSTQQQQQPAATGGLFGSSTQQQPATTTGGLFGSSTQQQPPASGGLFGSSTQQQPAQTGGLFGSSTQQQPAQTGGLFGSSTQQQPAQNGGLFGQSTQQQQPGSNSFFRGSTNNTTQNTQPQPQPSLFGAKQAASANQQPTWGRLSMGVNANNNNTNNSTATGQNTIPAVKIDLANIRPTTRYEELTDQMKSELEAIDKMIQQQEDFCRQIEAMMPKHGQDINGLSPDVDFIRDKVDAIEHALGSDAQGVDGQRRVAEQDGTDVERCGRIVANLNLPQGYQFANLGYAGGAYGNQNAQRGGSNNHQNNPSSSDDSNPADPHATDLVGNYFLPLAAQMQSTMSKYAENLVEIEGHMRVIEGGALGRARSLAQRKAGTAAGGGSGGNETVRELADTLRGFEASILGVAGAVGECREGVNELVLGRGGVAMGMGRY